MTAYNTVLEDKLRECILKDDAAAVRAEIAANNKCVKELKDCLQKLAKNIVQDDQLEIMRAILDNCCGDEGLSGADSDEQKSRELFYLLVVNASQTVCSNFVSTKSAFISCSRKCTPTTKRRITPN